MDTNPPWNDLRQRLRGAGLPPGDIRRLMGELRDHHRDLLDEALAAGMRPEEAELTAEQRLGGIDELAAAAVVRFRKNTWAGRHPAIIFGITPVFALLLIWILRLMAAYVGGSALIARSATLRAMLVACGPIAAWMLSFALPTLMAIFYYRAARRRALATVWCIVPVLCIAITTLFLALDVTRPTATTRSRVLLGFQPVPQVLPVLLLVACTWLYARWMRGSAQVRQSRVTKVVAE